MAEIFKIVSLRSWDYFFPLVFVPAGAALPASLAPSAGLTSAGFPLPAAGALSLPIVLCLLKRD